MSKIAEDDLIKICALGHISPEMSLVSVTRAFVKRGMLNRKVCEIISEEARRRDCGSLDRVVHKIVREIVKNSGDDGITFHDIIYLVPSHRPKDVSSQLIFQALHGMIRSKSMLCDKRSRPFIYKMA